MDALVLDTNIVSYLMRGHSLAEQYRPHLEGKTLAVSFMTVAELYEGAFRNRWGLTKMNHLETQLKNYLIVPYSYSVCLVWGEIRSERKSQPISVDDAWIAATALAHDCPLVTHNPKNFGNITNLEIITRYHD